MPLSKRKNLEKPSLEMKASLWWKFLSRRGETHGGKFDSPVAELEVDMVSCCDDRVATGVRADTRQDGGPGAEQVDADILSWVLQTGEVHLNILKHNDSQYLLTGPAAGVCTSA